VQLGITILLLKPYEIVVLNCTSYRERARLAGDSARRCRLSGKMSSTVLEQMKQWFVYIVNCTDDTLYTGLTTDVNRRVKEHHSSTKGAKYTQTRRPVRFVYSEPAENRSDASKREYVINTLRRTDKYVLTQSCLLSV
jgi:putative endonuclease